MSHFPRLLRVASVFSVTLSLVACSDGGDDTGCYDPLGAGCGQGGSGASGSGGAGGGGGGLPAQPTTFFEGTYTANAVDYAWQFNQELTAVANLAKAFDWAAVEARTAPGTLLGDVLDAREVEFSLTDAAKQRSPKALCAQGIALGKASGGDATKDDIALQYVEKSLIVLTELYAYHEIVEALEGTVVEEAALEIDAAAIILATLEGRMISRSTSELPDLWGAGSTLITTDALAKHTGELLFSARGKVVSGAPDGKAALEAARIYASKYFYASVLNYGGKIEAALAAGGDPAVEHVEGAVFSEGLSTAFFGDKDSAAEPLRALWTGPASGITTSANRAAVIGVYQTLTRDAASYYWLPEQPLPEGMIESAGRIAGAVFVLREALGASGADVAALEQKAADLAVKSAANDIPGAAAIAMEIETAVDAANP